MCSVQKPTIQQVPDFIHVYLKVGDLQQIKKHEAVNFRKTEGERQKQGSDTEREGGRQKGRSLWKYAKWCCSNLSSSGSDEVLSSIRRLWCKREKKPKQILRDYHGLYIMIYWCLADSTQSIHVRITSQAPIWTPTECIRVCKTKTEHVHPCVTPAPMYT